MGYSVCLKTEAQVIRTQSRLIVFCIALIVSAALSGCSKKGSQPSLSIVQDHGNQKSGSDVSGTPSTANSTKTEQSNTSTRSADDFTGQARGLGNLLDGIDLTAAFEEASKNPKQSISQPLKTRIQSLLTHVQKTKEVPSDAIANIYFDYLVELSSDKKRDYEQARTFLKSLGPVEFTELKPTIEKKLKGMGRVLTRQLSTPEPLEQYFSGTISTLSSTIFLNAARLYASQNEKDAFLGMNRMFASAGRHLIDPSKKSGYRTQLIKDEEGPGRVLSELGDLSRAGDKFGYLILNADVYTLLMLVMSQQDEFFQPDLILNALSNHARAYGLNPSDASALFKKLKSEREEGMKANEGGMPQIAFSPRTYFKPVMPLGVGEHPFHSKTFYDEDGNQLVDGLDSKKEKPFLANVLKNQSYETEDGFERGFDLIFEDGEEISTGIPRSVYQRWALLESVLQPVAFRGAGTRGYYVLDLNGATSNWDLPEAASECLISMTSKDKMLRWEWEQEKPGSSVYIFRKFKNSGTAEVPNWLVDPSHNPKSLQMVSEDVLQD